MSALNHMMSDTLAAIDNLMLVGATRALEARARRDELQAECYAKLRDELLHALATDPQAEVMTPGFGRVRTATADVIADDLGGDDKALHELLKFVAAAAAGEDVQLRAVLWMNQQAHRHAAFHAGDMALEIEEAEA
jgi:hypothetical protein